MIRSVRVFGLYRFHRIPMVSPCRVPIASARTNRTPLRRASAVLMRRWMSSTSNGSISSSSIRGAFASATGLRTMCPRRSASPNAVRAVR